MTQNKRNFKIEKQWFEKRNERNSRKKSEWIGFNDEQWSSIKNPVSAENTQTEESEFSSNHEGTIRHNGFSRDDEKQRFVQYAYKLWGMDLVIVMECENWNWNIWAVWDSWHAFGLCQMNDRYHKDFPMEYKTNGIVQVEYCYQKRKNGTKYYWPDRIIPWTNQRCRNYVKKRFTFE